MAMAWVGSRVASEDLDRLARAQLHQGALPGLGLASGPAAAPRLAAHARGVDRLDVHVEQLLDGLADLDLVGRERHAEVVGVALGRVVGGLLGDHRLLDHAVHALQVGHWAPPCALAAATPTRSARASKAPSSASTRRAAITSCAQTSIDARTKTCGKLRSDFHTGTLWSLVMTSSWRRSPAARSNAPAPASSARAVFDEGAPRPDRSTCTTSPSASLPYSAERSATRFSLVGSA